MAVIFEVSVALVGVPPCAHRDIVLVRPLAGRCPLARRAVDSALLVQRALNSVLLVQLSPSSLTHSLGVGVLRCWHQPPPRRPPEGTTRLTSQGAAILSPTPLSQIFSNGRRQISECAPPSAEQFRQFGEDPYCCIAHVMHRRLGLASPGSVTIGCQGVTLISLLRNKK